MRRPDCPSWCTYDHSNDHQLPGDVINHLGVLASTSSDEPIRIEIMRSDLPTGDKLTTYALVGHDYDAGEFDLPSDPDALDELAAIIASAAATIRDSTQLP